MKKMFLIAAAMMLSAVYANAATADGDFFIGKWELTIIGVPEGDITSTTTITRGEEGLEASFIMDGMDQEMKCSRVDAESADTLVLYFTVQGYDAYIVLDKGADDDSVKGSAMDMLDVTGKRIKE